MEGQRAARGTTRTLTLRQPPHSIPTCRTQQGTVDCGRQGLQLPRHAAQLVRRGARDGADRLHLWGRVCEWVAPRQGMRRIKRAPSEEEPGGSSLGRSGAGGRSARSSARVRGAGRVALATATSQHKSPWRTAPAGAQLPAPSCARTQPGPPRLTLPWCTALALLRLLLWLAWAGCHQT